ncbi:MAG: hypothetical protein ABFS42_02595 [Candidatus Krumholzibacteriota bacterium]
MKSIFLIAIFLSGIGTATATEIQVGVFVGLGGEPDRTITCVSGPPGATFEQVAWAWIPEELGLAYVTLRFVFPTNLDLTSRPVFHAQVSEVIFTEFVDGTSEWNMIFDGCPSGWVRIFTQECVLLDTQPSRIGIVGVRSMVRDCTTFVLNDVAVLNEIEVNDPACAVVSAETVTWGGIKSIFH